MKASAGIIFASMLIGSFVGATIGAQTANVMHAARYMNPDWANLGPAFIILFGTLSALGGLELGGWIVAVRAGNQHAPVGLRRRLGITRALMRLITAAIGLRLGYEAGMWTALIWDTWGSTAQNAAEGSLEFANVWIGATCLWGGALAILGYWRGGTLPPFLGFVGALVALHARLYLILPVAHLYWGPYPSSDFHAFVLAAADFLTTAVLLPIFALTGYWSGRWLCRRHPLGGSVCGTIADSHSPSGSPLARD